MRPARERHGGQMTWRCGGLVLLAMLAGCTQPIGGSTALDDETTRISGRGSGIVDFTEGKMHSSLETDSPTGLWLEREGEGIYKTTSTPTTTLSAMNRLAYDSPKDFYLENGTIELAPDGTIVASAGILSSNASAVITAQTPARLARIEQLAAITDAQMEVAKAQLEMIGDGLGAAFEAAVEVAKAYRATVSPGP